MLNFLRSNNPIYFFFSSAIIPIIALLYYVNSSNLLWTIESFFQLNPAILYVLYSFTGFFTALRINLIIDYLEEITPHATARIEKVRANLLNKISELSINNVDENRFEQELIYYLEKQDITEEQIRLKAHLDYFIQTIRSEAPNGKKLGFISQEIGREINTIGSKSSDAEMQKIVVQMKDALEKIKEQLLNVL